MLIRSDIKLIETSCEHYPLIEIDINKDVVFLEDNGCPAFQANGDADSHIVKTSVEAASERRTM